jgi:putative membrane protein
MSLRRVSWLSVFLIVLVWSGINPKDQVTWLLEVSPALVGFAILVYTRDSFRLTTLTYTLILVHCVILMIGGHYTYAEVPLGEWFRELTAGDRNDYDKLGHFVQGFIPAIIAREISLRLKIFNSRAWMNFFIVSMCLGISAFYELLEWWVALLSEEAADAFLGTQGYVWDTQSDMAIAFFGAIAGLVVLGKYHDKQLDDHTRSDGGKEDE